MRNSHLHLSCSCPIYGAQQPDKSGNYNCSLTRQNPLCVFWPGGYMGNASHLDLIACAFCKGEGRDPFGIMSQESVCQVCNGTGTHHIVKPHITCAYCHGSGVEFGTRNTCLSCGGKGQISMNKQHVPCTSCHGTGMEEKSDLRCDKCGGAGVVEKK